MIYNSLVYGVLAYFLDFCNLFIAKGGIYFLLQFNICFIIF